MEGKDEIRKSAGAEDFESMLEASLSRKDFFSVGDEVSGVVVLITQDTVLVDISGKSEAMVDRAEFVDQSGAITVKTGDRIKGIVSSTRRGEIRLTTRIGMGELNFDLLRKAYEEELPVSGTVTGSVKGGYRVSISGIPAFCPVSQMDNQGRDETDLTGKAFEFKIMEFKEGGRNIIVSRRALVEMKREQRRREILASVKVGDTIQGTVVSVQNFGILVDLDGVEALVPRTEISWSRQADTSVFRPGSRVSARVLALETENRIVLSIRQLSPEPWSAIGSFSEGQTVNGKVTNTIKSGAFVEIAPGIEGFVPLSRMSLVRRIQSPSDVVSTGDSVQVRILEINTGDRKILLELVTGEADPWQDSAEAIEERLHDAIVESSRPTGATVRLSNGMEGYLPKGEMLANRGDIQSAYPAGKEVKVVVKDLNRAERKLIVSEKHAEMKKEIGEYEEYSRQQSQAPSGSATLGNLFKDKFDELNRKIKK